MLVLEEEARQELLDGVPAGSSEGGCGGTRADTGGGRRGPNLLPQLLPVLRLQGQGKQQSCAEASFLRTPGVLDVSTAAAVVYGTGGIYPSLHIIGHNVWYITADVLCFQRKT